MPHALPQRPQLSWSSMVLVQMSPQSVAPIGQPSTQRPDSQCCVEVQVLPHAPQLRLSRVMSTHDVPHMVPGDGHEGAVVQTPAVQT